MLTVLYLFIYTCIPYKTGIVYPSRTACLTLWEHIGLTYATIWISALFCFCLVRAIFLALCCVVYLLVFVLYLVFYVVDVSGLSIQHCPFSCLYRLFTMSLDCPFSIAPSDFFNVYIHLRTLHIPDNPKISKITKLTSSLSFIIFGSVFSFITLHVQ